MPSFSFRKRSGYTFLDLFIAIIIIAILAVGLLLLFSNMREKARDSQRMSDVQTLKQAVEQHYADQSYYPAPEAVSQAITDKQFINTIPSDPLSD